MADGLDLREWKKLTRDLKDFKPDKQVKKVLRGAGERIALDAKALVSPYSQSIPGTIKVTVRKTSVTVSAGGGAKALAREMASASYGTAKAEAHLRSLRRRAGTMAIAGLFEFGNKGGSKSASSTDRGTFRHPTYGHDPWVNQSMHRYLMPARERNRHAIEHLEGNIVAEAFREVGWRGP